MSFIANAPAPVPAPPAAGVPPAGVVQNDGWFPDIDLNALREAKRLDGTVTDARLLEAVINAMLHVNDQLTAWCDTQEAGGYASMELVPAKPIKGESRLLWQYRRAVYCFAKADLTENYRDYDTTASSLSDKKTAEALNDAPAEQRRNGHWALADIIGRPHITVELI